MGTFSLFKVWATVALIFCTSNLCLAAEGDSDLLNSEVEKCKSRTSTEFEGKASMDDRSPSCSSMLPLMDNDNSASAQDKKDRREQQQACVIVERCISSAKSALERTEGKCDSAIKNYNDAWDKFDKACSKTGVSDCRGAARDCENKRTSLAESGTFADTLNNSLQIYGMARLNNAQNTGSQANLNALNKCPQLSYKSYFDRKKELDEKIDKKTRDIEKTEEDIEKKKEEINKAKTEANDAIKKLDEDIQKNLEKLNQEKDEAKRKNIENDNKRMQAERDTLQKLTKLQEEMERTSYQAGIDAKLMKQRMGLDPSEQERQFTCMAGVKAKVAEFKALSSGPATKRTKELRENLNVAFKKCMASQDMALKEARAKEAKATFDLKAKLTAMQNDADQLNEEINRLKSQGLIQGQLDQKSQQDLQTAATQKDTNLQTSRATSAQNSAEKIKTLQDSISAQGTYQKKIYNLRVEIQKAQDELAGLGPVPPADYEASSYKDSTATWDRVLDAQTLLEKYKGSCAGAAALLEKSAASRYDRSSGGGSTGGTGGSR